MWMNRDEILEHLACSHRSLTRKVRAGNIESKADPNHRSRRLYRAITPSTIIRRSPSQLPPAASSTPSPNLVNELAEIKEQLTSVLAEVATLRALLMASKANPLSLDDRTGSRLTRNPRPEKPRSGVRIDLRPVVGRPLGDQSISFRHYTTDHRGG